MACKLSLSLRERETDRQKERDPTGLFKLLNIQIEQIQL